MRLENLRSWLTDWAYWFASQTGYPSQTITSHLMISGGISRGEFKSCPPIGADIPKGLREIHQAMQELSNTRDEPYIQAVRYYYLIGLEGAKELLKCSTATLKWKKHAGEKALAHKLG